MIDVFPPADDSLDIGEFETTVPRATNILSVQVGALEYAPDLGIDLAFFLSEQFKFQDDSFKAYLVEVLAFRGINVSELIETIDSLSSQYSFKVQANETTTALIAR